MFPSQGAIAILQAPAGEQAALAAGSLPFQVELRSPLAGDTVFQFGVRREVGMLSGAGCTYGGGSCDLQIARLFHVVIVGDEVGGLLGGCEGKSKRDQE